MKQKSACSCLGIDPFGKGFEANATPFKLRNQRNQMPEVAAKPIQFPDHKGISSFENSEGLIELWAALHRSGDVVGEYAVAASNVESVDLKSRIFVVGRHTRIPNHHR